MAISLGSGSLGMCGVAEELSYFCWVSSWRESSPAWLCPDSDGSPELLSAWGLFAVLLGGRNPPRLHLPQDSSCPPGAGLALAMSLLLLLLLGGWGQSLFWAANLGQ